MPQAWTIEKLRSKSHEEIRTLYTNARARNDDQARALAETILDSGLLVGSDGGLPFDHPDMLEIEEICGRPEAIDEAVEASEAGLPALAGMEYRLVRALGKRYGPNYTTNHAGRCIRDGMASRGWKTTVQRSMPEGSVAKTATVYVRKER